MRCREIDLYLHEGMIKDLIISHLHNIGVIRNSEEVVDLVIGDKTASLHKLTVRFEPDTQVIFHE